MNMFPSLLDLIPKNRSELVNDFDLPDVAVSPYIWSPDETLRSESSSSLAELEDKTVYSDSSLALSRAMTDSEIDYGRYRRLKNRSCSDPWVELKTALDAFPARYLESLNSFQDTVSETNDSSLERGCYNEELRLKMERFFQEECRVFSPDDPGFIDLEEALRNCDLKDSDLDSSLPIKTL